MKQKILALVLATILFPAALVAQVSFGKATLWADGWKQTVGAPIAGTTTYTKTFNMKDLRKAETYHLYLDGFKGGVGAEMQVYLNGHLLGSRTNGYVSFIYEMTPYIDKEQDNVLKLVATGKNKELGRDIYLVTAPKTHLSKWGIEYQYQPDSDGNGRLLISSSTTWIHDEGYSLSAELSDDMEGKHVVATSEEIPLAVDADSIHQLHIPLSEAKVWNLSRPNLYLLTVMLHKGGKVVRRGKVTVGLQTTELVNNKKLLLNGQPVLLKKFVYEEKEPLAKEEMRKQLIGLKSKGYNAIVLQCPQVPAFYDLCDELGVLVFEGKAGKWASADVGDIYQRDRVHPSVIFDKQYWK